MTMAEKLDDTCAVHTAECNLPGKEEAAARGGGQTCRRGQKVIAAATARRSYRKMNGECLLPAAVVITVTSVKSETI